MPQECKHVIVRIDGVYTLCTRCAPELLTGTLSPRQFANLIRIHNSDEFYLSDNFYTNGVPNNPVWQGNEAIDVSVPFYSTLPAYDADSGSWLDSHTGQYYKPE